MTQLIGNNFLCKYNRNVLFTNADADVAGASSESSTAIQSLLVRRQEREKRQRSNVGRKTKGLISAYAALERGELRRIEYEHFSDRHFFSTSPRVSVRPSVMDRLEITSAMDPSPRWIRCRLISGCNLPPKWTDC